MNGANGNVNIGTGNNDAKLNVNGDGLSTSATNSHILLRNRNNTTGDKTLITNQVSSSGGAAYSPVAFGAINSQQTLREGAFVVYVSDAQTVDLAADERLRITNDGFVGIGTASPTGILECKSAGNTQVYITAGNSSASELFFGDAADVDVGKITYLHGDNAMKFQTNTSEAMRIDSSGRLLFGKTSSDNAVPGVKLSGGQIIGTVANDDIMILNRTGSDGKILRFFKDTSEVGSIRAEGGDIVVGNDTRGLKYRDTDFIPRDMDNTTSDNQVTLGSSGSRFADIYLGGGAFIGGTGTANKLDDYEEGTWTPAYTGSTTTGTGVTGAGQCNQTYLHKSKVKKHQNLHQKQKTGSLYLKDLNKCLG